MTNARILPTLILASLVVWLAAPPLVAKDDGQSVLNLTIGDPARKDRQVELVLDGITDTRTGEVIVPSDLPGKVADATDWLLETIGGLVGYSCLWLLIPVWQSGRADTAPRPASARRR